MLVGLISCSKAKTPYPAPARELYSPSGLFRGALKDLEGRADVSYVLSAKYGLLPLDRVIDPYDQTLKDATPTERAAWARSVAQALHARHGSTFAGITFEFHAGMAYRVSLEEMLRNAGGTCTCPVQGLTMGERLAYYAGDKPQTPRAREVQMVRSQAAAAAAPHVSAAGTADLRQVASSLRHQTVQTATGIPFLVTAVDSHAVTVAPERTGKPRPVPWRELEAGYDLLLRTRSATLADLRQHASEANPAYMFGILSQVPGTRVIPRRPVRLVLDP
jgi:hypothetical protein